MKKTFVLLRVFVLLMVLAIVPTAGAKTLDTPSGYTAYNIEAGSVTIGSGKYHIYGTKQQTANTIKVSSGAVAEIILDDVNIDTGKDAFVAAIELEKNAKVTLKLAGENTLVGGNHKACIHVPGGTELTITSASGDDKNEGVLQANARANYIVNGRGDVGFGPAAIGAHGIMNQNNPRETLGDIIINGGTIEATGATGGAGIGGAGFSTTGSITINGGKVNASVDSTSSYSSGAGIGGGALGYVPSITIHGGYVSAFGSNAGGGADIGGGYAGSSYGDIRITGGTVYAMEIGHSNMYCSDQPGSVVITGGSVQSDDIDNPKNEQGQLLVKRVYPQSNTCEGAPITSATFTGGYSYGIEDVVVRNGNFTFWLPEGIESTPDAQKYTVTFDANGANGAMESVNVYGVYTLPFSEYKMADHQFAGWSYSANGPIIQNDRIWVYEPTTLYAIWRQAEAAYSFDNYTIYSSFEEAVAASTNPSYESLHIRLLKNVTVNDANYQPKFYMGKDVTLDLNGKTLTSTVGAPLRLEKTNLRIVDTSSVPGAVNGDANYPAISLVGSNNLTIENGVFTANMDVIIASGSGNNVIIHEGEFRSNTDNAVSLPAGNSLTVHGGIFEGKTTISVNSSSAEIFGGTFKGKDNTRALDSNGTVSIHGGSFLSEITTPTYATIANLGIMMIHGGTVESGNGFAISNGEQGQLTITGGTFEQGRFGAVGITNGKLDFTGYAQAEGVSLFVPNSSMDVAEHIDLAPGYAVLNADNEPVNIIEGWMEGYKIGLLPLHDITAEQTEGGVVGINKTVASQGMPVTIIVEVFDQYRLVSLTVNEEPIAISAAGGEYTFTMPNEDVTIEATFAPLHEHSWTYSGAAPGDAVIVATCANTDGSCPNKDGGSVSLAAPAAPTYSNAPIEAVVNNTLADESIAVAVVYTDAQGAVMTEKPVNAGTYTASITLGEGEGAVTVSVAYTISQREVTVTFTPGSGVYGGTITAPTAVVSGHVEGDEPEVTIGYSGTANDETAVSGTELPALAGSYTATAAITDDNYILTGENTIAFTIEKAVVAVPDIESRKYTGSNLTANVPASDLYTVQQNDGGTDVGEYDVVLSLTDKYNYKWMSYDDEPETITLKFEIVAEDTQTATKAAEEVTYGESITLTAQVGMSTISTFARGAVPQNQVAFYCGDVELGVADVVYNSDGTGGTATLVYNTSNRSLQPGNNEIVAYYGGSVNLNHSQSESITVKLNPRPITATFTPPASSSVGSVNVPETELENLVAGYAPEIAITYTDSQNNVSSEAPTDAGSYTVTVTIDDPYYALPENTNTTFEVDKAVVTVPDAGSKVYTGGTLKSDLTETETYTVTENNGGVNVGDYDVVLTLRDPDNYQWPDTEDASITIPFAIVQSGSQINPGENIDATYGDTIDLTAKVGVVQQSYSALRRTVAQDTVEFWCGENLLGSAEVTYDANGNGSATLKYDTAKRGLAIGANTIRAVYGGGVNMEGSTGDSTVVNLNPKNITVTITSIGGVYNGTITPASAHLNDLVSNDNPTVTLTYTGIANDGTEWESTDAPGLAGTYTVTASITDGYYSLTGDVDEMFVVSKASTIAAPTGIMATYGQTLGDVKDQLPDGWTWDDESASVGEVNQTNLHKADFAGDANHNPINGVDVTITVAQADTSLLVDVDAEYIYGQIIEIGVTPNADQPANVFAMLSRLVAPAAGTVTLYDGSEQLTDPQPAANGQEVSFTFDTTDREFPLLPGEYSWRAEFVATDNMKFAEAPVVFRVSYLPASANVPDAVIPSDGIGSDEWFADDPTLTAPDGYQISLDPAVWPEDGVTGNSVVPSTADGENVIIYYIRQPDGTVAEQEVTINVDHTDPTVSQSQISSTDTTAQINASATDETSGVASYELVQTGGAGTPTITSNGNGSFTITGMTPGGAYTFDLTVTDHAGNTTTVPVTLTASPAPRILSPLEAAEVSILVGETAVFDVVAENAYRYEWYKSVDGGVTFSPAGKTTSSYESAPVTLENDGYQYFCRVYGESGVVYADSPIFTLHVMKPVPETGDTSRTGLWLALMSLSFAGCMMILAQYKRREN